jgi:hypothetical protein
MKKDFKIFCCLMLCIGMTAYGQSGVNRFLKPSDTLNIPRFNAVIVGEGAFYIGGVLGLNDGLSHDYLNHKFHQDYARNLQMDKAAHIFASYQIGNLFFNSLKWSGTSEQTQLIYGAGMGFIFLTSIELVEGFSHYGYSYKDILANGIGTSLFVSQELLWKEQRIVVKISFKNSDFISPSPSQMKAQIMHEFDDQTVWMSVNLRSFFKNDKIPKWLNIAVGYGVEGISSTNYIKVGDLNQKADAYRQFYISFDADLTKIDTKSHFLKTVFAVFNTIKIPAPTIEYSVNEGFRARGLYF